MSEFTCDISGIKFETKDTNLDKQSYLLGYADGKEIGMKKGIDEGYQNALMDVRDEVKKIITDAQNNNKFDEVSIIPLMGTYDSLSLYIDKLKKGKSDE